MKRLPSFLHETGDSLGASSGFLEELRESFTGSFAYDRFDWPETSASASVSFRPLAASDPAASGSDGDAVSLYTSNADIPIYLLGEVVPVEGDAGLVPQSNVSGPLVAIDDFRADARFSDIDGSGYAVAVLDTGIDLDDPFFGPDSNNDGISDRIVYSYDFADNDSNAGDFNGHGSNVTSIATSSDGTYTGMAPGADIVALKVFSDSGSGNFGYLEDALQWVIANAAAYNIVSVNMSLSDSGNYSSAVQLYGIADELSALASMNVIVVSASGNDFYEFNSIQGVAYPSADPNSLSVGAVYEGSYGQYSYFGPTAYSTGADRITPFSQRDDQLSDIFAPGAPITGAGSGAGLVTMHGTSQAAPHIAGIVALAQQLAVQEIGRQLTFDEIAQLLEDSGDTIIDGDDEDDNVTNTGQAFQRVNVLALGEAILAMAPDGPEAFFSIAADDAVKPEGDSGTTSYSFTVTRSGDTSGSGSVDYAVSGSGAEPATADDFAGTGFPGGTVSFAAGQTSQTVTIEVLGDSEVEVDEAFTVALTNPSAGSEIIAAEAEGSIVNDDTAPVGPVVLLQADFDQGGDTAGFVYKDGLFGGANPQAYADGSWGSQALTVTLGGGDNADINNMSGGWETSFTLDAEAEVSLSFLYSLTINANYESNEFTQVLVSIDGGTPILVDQLTGDGNGGSDQTTGTQSFSVVLGNLAAGSHTLAIGALNNQKTWNNEVSSLVIDDVLLSSDGDTPPPPAIDTFFTIVADDAVQGEGDAGTTAFTFTVTRSGDTSAAGSVDYAVTGSDVDGADFLGGALPSGSVNFAAGETSQTVTVNVSGDTDFEGDEAFIVTLTNPSADSEITVASAEGTILNDDAAPPSTFLAIAADDAVKAEGDAGSTAFTFTVTRSGDTSSGGSVDYAVSNTEVDSNDFVGGTPFGTLTFAGGETSKTVTINVAGDLLFEDDEPLTVSLLNASSGSLIVTASASGIILNDDTASPATYFTIAEEDVVIEEGDSGPTLYTFSVWRSGDTSSAGSVDYAVSGGDVDAGDFLDGVLPSGTVSFVANEIGKIFTIAVSGDTDFEGDESFTVTLSNPSAGSEITIASAEGTILNDDAAPPATFFDIAAADAVQSEGDAGTTAFTFTVSRSGDTSGAGSADYAVSGSDVDGTDFLGGALPGGSVAFAAGEVSKTVTVEVAGDTEVEGDEAFTVTLSNASAGSAITTASAEGTILNDDAPPSGPIVLIDETFDANGATGGFAYADGVLGGTDPQAYADGAWAGGALSVDLGGIDTTTVTDISGGWTRDFTLDAEAEVTLSFLYELTQSADYEADEVSQVLVSIDGGAPILVASLTGDGNGGGAQTSGPQSFNAMIGILAAGSHSLTLGGFNNKKTWDNESTQVTLDDVSLVATPTTPPPPIVTSFGIAALDAVQDEGDGGTTAFTFTVTRSGDTSAAGSVDYAVSGGVDGDDFAGGLLPSGTLSFAAGEISTTLTLQGAGDTDFEPDEAFTVTLSNPSPGSDIAGAAAEGSILNDDTLPAEPLVLVEASFDGAGDTEGFVYADGVFGGANPQADASGSWSSGALVIDLGGGGNSTVLDISGAWEIDFVLATEMDVELSFTYELIISSDYEASEFGQVLVSLDGATPVLIEELVGNGNGGADDSSGLQSLALDLGLLDAGSHSLAIGGYNNQKTWGNEATEITLDDVLVTGTLPAAPAAASAGPVGQFGGDSLSALTRTAYSETELQSLAGV